MKYLTRTNIGYALAIGLSAFLMMGTIGKLFGGSEGFAEMGATHIESWMKIIGAGELISIILFLIPKTYKLGTVLLSAFFGGAIMFHMAHADVAHQSIIGPSVFLVALWIISWIRGNELISFNNA